MPESREDLLNKLNVIEDKLKKSREQLNKTWLGGTETSAQSGGTTQGTSGSGSGESIADKIDFGKEEGMSVEEAVKRIKTDKLQVQDVLKEVPEELRDEVLEALREDSTEKAEDHKDEKEDKEMVAEAMDQHNEKKHGESKNKDSAYDDMGVEKNVNRTYSDQRSTSYTGSNMVKFHKNGQWSVEKVAPEGVDEEKYDRCVEEVKEEDGDAKNAYAICSASLQDEADKD